MQIDAIADNKLEEHHLVMLIMTGSHYRTFKDLANGGVELKRKSNGTSVEKYRK